MRLKPSGCDSRLGQSFANFLCETTGSDNLGMPVASLLRVREVIMKSKLTIIAVMVLTVVLGIPMDGFGAGRPTKETTVLPGSTTQISVRIGQPRRRRMRRGGYWRNGVYYRNYGQYRRSTVGNRRYRVVPRYYWYDGVRRVRYVRYYY
jgi:hypothetical protein